MMCDRGICRDSHSPEEAAVSETPVERAKDAVQEARAAASEAVESSDEATRQLEAIEGADPHGLGDAGAEGGIDLSGGGGGASGGGTTND